MHDLATLPGVRLERRAFLKLSVGALAGLLAGCNLKGVLAPGAPLTLDGLMDRIHPWAERLTAGAPGRRRQRRGH